MISWGIPHRKLLCFSENQGDEEEEEDDDDDDDDDMIR